MWKAKYLLEKYKEKMEASLEEGCSSTINNIKQVDKANKNENVLQVYNRERNSYLSFLPNPKRAPK